MCVCLCTGTAFFACVWGKEPLLFSPDPCLQGAARGNYFPLRRKRFTTLRQREMTVALSLPVDRIPWSIMQLSTAEAATGRARRRGMYFRRRGKRRDRRWQWQRRARSRR